eukprot:CAMPEP_0194519094 /NCGR_PEP_ID=MMETSP0253-20130528/52662_1 /TAXON_ID=2966 /ORGANISM="Noctiluca scintillans" /LENGTH=480 /DNA_ID=CAMNT_0039363187 /DNA_START=46 /DNA_END=1488 /DNA_ORIENTATION=+
MQNVVYPRKITPHPLGLPEGWSGWEKQYLSGLYRGYTYVRFEKNNGMHPHTLSVTQAIKLDAMDKGLDPKKALKAYDKKRKKIASENARVREQNEKETKKRKEESHRIFQKHFGSLDTAVVQALPGWQVRYEFLQACNQIHNEYRDPTGKSWRLIKDIEIHFGGRMLEGEDITELMMYARQQRNPIECQKRKALATRQLKLQASALRRRTEPDGPLPKQRRLRTTPQTQETSPLTMKPERLDFALGPVSIKTERRTVTSRRVKRQFQRSLPAKANTYYMRRKMIGKRSGLHTRGSRFAYADSTVRNFRRTPNQIMDNPCGRYASADCVRPCGRQVARPYGRRVLGKRSQGRLSTLLSSLVESTQQFVPGAVHTFLMSLDEFERKKVLLEAMNIVPPRCQTEVDTNLTVKRAKVEHMTLDQTKTKKLSVTPEDAKVEQPGERSWPGNMKLEENLMLESMKVERDSVQTGTEPTRRRRKTLK